MRTKRVRPAKVSIITSHSNQAGVLFLPIEHSEEILVLTEKRGLLSISIFSCLIWFTLITLSAGAQTTASNEWTWMGGSSTEPVQGSGDAGVYGTLGKPAAENVPGSRSSASSWTDREGNLWLFGGDGFDSKGVEGYLNDLWEFQPSISEWAWMGGSDTVPAANGGQPGVYGKLGTPAAGNIPGSRYGGSSWTDSSGKLWLFGGTGIDTAGGLCTFNDLWEFDSATDEWAWMGGTKLPNPDGDFQSGVYGTFGMPAIGNIPGSRYNASSWTNNSGHLWLFGGYGYDANGEPGYLDDLWEFNPSTNEWAWMGGSKTVGNSNPGGQPGVYGTLGTPAAGNVPGSRAWASSWTDGSGNLWLFGGWGFDAGRTTGYLNDAWEFNLASDEWTWMGGSDTVPAQYGGRSGTYGTLGIPAAGNIPGGREASSAWADNGGHAWLFGGWGPDASGTIGFLNDLWEFNPSTNRWTWMGGSKSVPSADTGQPGVYGKLGVPAAGNIPGGRELGTQWTDSLGNLWLLGGDVNVNFSTLALGEGNDLWDFQPPTPAAVLTSPTPSSALSSTAVKFTWTAGTDASATYDLHLSAVAPGGYDLYLSGHIAGTSTTATNLPINGGTIFARLYTIVDGYTQYNDYTYKAMTATLAQMIYPAPGSTLTTSKVWFDWTPGTGVTQYDLHLSAVAAGGYDLDASGPITRTYKTVFSIPLNGETIYARLYSIIDGELQYIDYTYKTQ
jgi:N-acetylneuraminic acid mutarotase